MCNVFTQENFVSRSLFFLLKGILVGYLLAAELGLEVSVVFIGS